MKVLFKERLKPRYCRGVNSFLSLISTGVGRVEGAIVLIVLQASLAFAQVGKELSLNQLSDLIRNGVAPARVAQLVEEHGVAFELDERTLRRLRQDGASDDVLSAVKRKAAQYSETKAQRKPTEKKATKNNKPEADRKGEKKKNDLRCGDILNRSQLGEPLTEEDKAIFSRCK